MNRVSTYILLLLSLVVAAGDGWCTNIKVTNPARGALSGGSTTVTFNVTWNSSWRRSTIIGNWDAAWAFVKFRKNGGNWAHASLNNTGHTAPAGSIITTGLVDTSSAFNIATNPAVGVFIYRSGDGSGTFTANNVSLSWNYSQDGVTSGDTVEIRVFAIEMVYIPYNGFFAGDNATSTNSFKQGSSDSDPWWIGSEDAITTTNTAGTGTNMAETAAEYYYPGSGDAAGSVFTIPAAFPKGYQSFYVMKGEVGQGQWVTFFNTLTATQQSTRDITSATGKNTDNLTYRNNVSWSGSGDATLPDRGGGATYEWTAMGYLSWADLTAYLDWAGLRPMSELEFEKVGRGAQRAVSGEYAWGDISITQANSITSAGLFDERAQTGANAAYGNHASVQGPLRVGSFSYGVATRIASGGGYYGARDLSGNLWERPVTIGNSTGRSFDGRYHGNGALDASGDPNVSTWPGTSAVGIGLRGGGWLDAVSYLRLSDRSSAASTDTTRYSNVGGRGVRTVSSDLNGPSSLLVSSNSGTSATLTTYAPTATEMYITNSSGCSSGGAWENKAATKSWTLVNSGDGTATVYARYRGMSGASSCLSHRVSVTGTPLSSEGVSCASILSGGGSRGSGIYYVDPDGAGSLSAENHFCNMDYSGGGWTLVTRTFADNTNISSTIPSTSEYESLSTVGSLTAHKYILGNDRQGFANWGAVANGAALNSVSDFGGNLQKYTSYVGGSTARTCNWVNGSGSFVIATTSQGACLKFGSGANSYWNGASDGSRFAALFYQGSPYDLSANTIFPPLNISILNGADNDYCSIMQNGTITNGHGYACRSSFLGASQVSQSDYIEVYAK